MNGEGKASSGSVSSVPHLTQLLIPSHFLNSLVLEGEKFMVERMEESKGGGEKAREVREGRGELEEWINKGGEQRKRR